MTAIGLRCPGCDRGDPRVDTHEAIQAARKLHGVERIPAGWSVCAGRRGGFHVPPAEIERVKGVLKP